MHIADATLTQFRLFEAQTAAFCRGVNVISGENGAGKTSLIEAIYVVTNGRSFRTRRLDALIRHGAPGFTVFIETADPAHALGINRVRAGEGRNRLDGEDVRSSAALARIIPTQIVNPESNAEILESPDARRRFIDWGLFHVKQSYLEDWRAFRVALAQRNKLLKRGGFRSAELDAWDDRFAALAAVLDASRREYLEDLQPWFEATVRELSDRAPPALNYASGWQGDLRAVLAERRDTDSERGFTSAGPQRADLRVRADDRDALAVLSRGQQKLLVYALKIAQGRLLAEVGGRSPVYLVDDLQSELDRRHQERLCRCFSGLDGQVFLTSLETASLAPWLAARETRLFHVEHGVLQPG